MTKSYEQALNDVREPSRKFFVIREAYRAKKVDEAEFLAARAEYIRAEKCFDGAFATESVTPADLLA